MAFRIVRSSINVFFDDYRHFTSIATLLVFPASAASLIVSQVLVPSSEPLVRAISFRLSALFRAARFPSSSLLFAILNVKLSQTIFSFVSTLPFTVTFLIAGKASVIRVVFGGRSRSRRRPVSVSLSLCLSVLLTYLFNSFLMLSVNAAVFAFLFVVFNAAELLGLSVDAGGPSLLLISAAGAVLYSVVIANATVVCSLALVISAVTNRGGDVPVLEACRLVRLRASTALAVALPANVGLAALEALFQHRVVRRYDVAGELSSALLWEAVSVAYLYALLLVLEVIINCKFYEACTTMVVDDEHGEHKQELEAEEKAAVLRL